MNSRLDWLRVVRHLTQYVVPSLIVLAVIIELTDLVGLFPGYNHVVAVGFSVLSVMMIALCGWVVFLWDIDRLFFRLENRIDAQLSGDGSAEEGSASLLNRAKEILNTKVQHVRTRAVSTIEKAYWEDINAGGVLAFPRPDIAAAVEHIDKSRRDLIAPLTDFVAAALPVGGAPASIIARMVFRFVSPEVKVRLYRRLVLRFLMQLGALFLLTALCFFISILGWSRASGSVFDQAAVAPASVALYQLDLMLRGALFDFMEHTQRSISPIRINHDATAFVYYTLLFRMFVAIYVFSSLFRVVRFVGRRWRALLR
jgi:hypothetical protein